MFRIFSANSVHKIEMFSLLLSNAYTVSRSFLPLTPLHQQGSWANTRGTQLGQLIPTHLRNISYHVVVCSAYRAGSRRKGGIFRVMLFVFQITTTCDGALLSWSWLNTCLTTANGEGIPCFALFVFTIYLNP